MEKKESLRARTSKYFIPMVIITIIGSFLYLVIIEPFIYPNRKEDMQLSAEEQYEQFNQVLDSFTSSFENPFDRLTDVLYGESSFQSAEHQILAADGELIQLFSSKPEGPGPFPAIVLMHGNSASDREATRFSLVMGERLAEELQAIVISVNWRDSELAKTDLIDIVSTIEWSKEVIEFIDQPLYLVGIERGAYLSLLASTKNDVDGVVNIFGYIDPNTQYQYLLENSPDAADNFLDITECGEAQITTRCLQSYEVASLLSEDMPILSIYGEAEKSVTIDQLALLESATNPARDAIVYTDDAINKDTLLIGTGDEFEIMYDEVFSWLSDQFEEQGITPKDDPNAEEVADDDQQNDSTAESDQFDVDSEQ